MDARALLLAALAPLALAGCNNTICGAGTISVTVDPSAAQPSEIKTVSASSVLYSVIRP